MKKGITFIATVFVIAIIGYFLMNVIGQIYRARFPIKYEETVNKYCNEYGIDPYLVYAIIKTESSFNERAVSYKDARGLMQIMPETGKWIAKEMKIEGYIDEDLFVPEKNIMMGIWYLKYLLKKFDNNTRYAIIAYNAGLGNLQEWLREGNNGEEENVLDKIPFEETERYEKKTMQNYEIYINLYEK